MDGIVKLLSIIFSMWIVQGILSYFQINHFRSRLAELKKKGEVLIGQHKGKLSAGSIVILVVDDKKNIIDAEEMIGFTVFKKFKKKYELIGKNLENQQSYISSIKNKQTLKAIEKVVKEVRKNSF